MRAGSRLTKSFHPAQTEGSASFDMAEVLLRVSAEVLITDPPMVDVECFDCWVKGMTVRETALKRRTACCGTGDDAATEDVLDLFQKETADYYHAFERIEHFLQQPGLLHDHLALSISETPEMVAARYYAIDDDVVRELFGKKLTVKARKDLDVIADALCVPLRSCRRVFDNLKRILTWLDETKGFHCCVAREIAAQYLLPPPLAARYSAICFVFYNKFTLQRSNRRTASLSLADIELLSATILANWVSEMPSSLGAPAANQPCFALREVAPLDAPSMAEVHARVARAYGLGLDQTFISLLRDLKTLFLANNERALDQMHAAVRRNLAEGTPPPLTPALMAAVDARFKSIMKSLISIGAGLSQLKEQRDLFEDLVIKVGEPLQTAGFDAVTATAVLDACVRMFPALVPTGPGAGDARQRSLHQAWVRFIAVVRAFCLLVVGRLGSSGGAMVRRLSFDS